MRSRWRSLRRPAATGGSRSRGAAAPAGASGTGQRRAARAAGRRRGGGGDASRAGRRGRGRQAGRRAGAALRRGRVLLGGATPAEKGVWLPGVGITNPLARTTVPFQPWAKALLDDRQKQRARAAHALQGRPASRVNSSRRTASNSSSCRNCSASTSSTSAARTPTAPSTWTAARIRRTLTPTYYGHSIGWWEGDTLVVDTTGFNEGFWIDRRGLPHTEKLRTLERFTRTDARRRYELTIDDPGAYTKPWTGGTSTCAGKQTPSCSNTCASRPTTRPSSWSASTAKSIAGP